MTFHEFLELVLANSTVEQLTVVLKGVSEIAWFGFLAWGFSSGSPETRTKTQQFFFLFCFLTATIWFVDPVQRPVTLARIGVIVWFLADFVKVTAPYVFLGFAASISVYSVMKIRAAGSLTPFTERTGVVPPVTPKKVLRNSATDQAKQLLLSRLDLEQRVCFERYGYFHVRVQLEQPDFVTGATYRLYRIMDTSRMGNVLELDPFTFTRLTSYCIHPLDADLPQYDVMLAQKMLLENDHGEFLKTANMRSPRVVTPQPGTSRIDNEDIVCRCTAYAVCVTCLTRSQDEVHRRVLRDHQRNMERHREARRERRLMIETDEEGRLIDVGRIRRSDCYGPPPEAIMPLPDLVVPMMTGALRNSAGLLAPLPSVMVLAAHAEAEGSGTQMMNLRAMQEVHLGAVQSVKLSDIIWRHGIGARRFVLSSREVDQLDLPRQPNRDAAFEYHVDPDRTVRRYIVAP